MILAKNSQAAQYLGIHPNLDLALEHITPEFLESLGNERVEIKGEDVYCTKFSYDTVADDEAFFEAHKSYLDIHIMLEGFERVEISSPDSLREIEEMRGKDFWAYRGAGEHSLILRPGNFLVVFPDDAHKIKMRADGKAWVTKAVFKVRIQ